MKTVGGEIANFKAEQISTLEKEGKIDVQGYEITLNDVEISTKDIPGWTVASNATLTVALDLQLTDELINEGIARELVNRVQNLRKETGLEVTDKIKLLLKNDEPIVKAVEGNQEYITSETLTVALDLVDAVENGVEVEINGIDTVIAIQKM